jgi:hypothetical protein
MNQTPEDPHPPTEPAPDDDSLLLAPLDEVPTRRRFPSVGRLVAVTVVVLALVGGAAAFAMGGNDEEPEAEGVASLDGSEGEVEDDGSSGNGQRGPADDSKVFDAMLKFAECMREHGIDMPDPEMGEGGVQMKAGAEGGPDSGNEEKFEAAHKACEHFMEDARADMPAPSPEERAEMQDKLMVMAECMRARGYDMPDPEVAEDGGVKMKMSRGGPQDSPGGDEQVQKDQEECNAEAGMEEGPGGEKGES